MNKYRKAGLVPHPGQVIRVFWHPQRGTREEGYAIMGEKSFVVDRFTVLSHFPSKTFPETYYCDDYGNTWLYADQS